MLPRTNKYNSSNKNKKVHYLIKKSILASKIKKGEEVTSFMFKLPDNIKKKIFNWVKSNIKMNDIYGKFDYGIEYNSHISFILYVIDNADDIYKKICDFGTIKCTMFKLSKFETENYDVLYISVDQKTNKKLQELYKMVRESVDYTQASWCTKYDKYTPHITIAYMKKGMADKYIKEFKYSFNKVNFLLDIIESSKETRLK